MEFKVSVIVPVFNAGSHIAQAAGSALALAEVGELIMVEDGSTDHSLSECMRIAATDSRAVLIRHHRGRNRGAAASRNVGIKAARYSYITFLDADDVYAPHRFAKAQRIFEAHPECEGVYEAVGTIEGGEAPNKPRLTTLQQAYAPEELFYKISPVGNRGYFSLIGFTAKKEVFDRVGLLNEKLRVSQDTEWMLRTVATCRLYPGSMKEPVSLRRIHPGNRTTDEAYMLRHKPAMALEALRWFLLHQRPADQVSELLRVYLKYHFEWVHLSGKGNWLWSKWRDVADGLKLYLAHPRLRGNPYLIYHLKMAFKLPVKKHLNYYEPGRS